MLEDVEVGGGLSVHSAPFDNLRFGVRRELPNRRHILASEPDPPLNALENTSFYDVLGLRRYSGLIYPDTGCSNLRP
jgi:hypothetical protein